MRDSEATSRFSDNPFRDPNLPPEQADYLDRRNSAMRHWRETGDPGPAKEFGFDLPDRRPVTVTGATTIEELIAAHHGGRPIMFGEGEDTAGLYCPGCGGWMDGERNDG